MDSFSSIENLFLKPEYTNSNCSFCDIPKPISFNESNVNIIGLPIDITTTFGKTASYGPEVIRITSAKQIETFVYEKNIEVFDRSLIFDLGDLILPSQKQIDIHNKKEIQLFWEDFDRQISKIISFLLSNKKKPVILGGEHTIIYSLFKEFSKNEPLMLHFDAHRDLKPIYDGMKICHTTPFYHLINEGYLNGKDLVQIGIRQADKNENLFALERGIITFDAWDCYNSYSNLKHWLKENSQNRDIYISFDIDVYDISYVPCTGTPEPFGLTPFQISEIINSIDDSSNLIGLDFVETGLKNNDYREGALATQTLLRILTHNFINN
jgi:arginase family enzyme